MPDPVEFDPRESKPARSKVGWVRWAKRVIALLVMVALVLAAKDAVQRWQMEVAAVRSEVDLLDQQLSPKHVGGEVSPELPGHERTQLIEQRERLLKSLPTWSNVSVGALALAAAFYALGLLPPALVLHAALRGFGVRCSLLRTTAAQLLGHLGKYVPGKAVVVVLRVSAIVAGGELIPRCELVPRETLVSSEMTSASPESKRSLIGRATSCVFFETLLMMSVGGALAGVLMWSTPLPQWVKWAASLMAIAASIPTLPPVMRRVIAIVSRRRANAKNAGLDSPETAAPPSEDLSTAITWPRLMLGWFWSLCSWCLIGLSFACVMKSIPAYNGLPMGGHLLVVATAAISLGMVLGFASLLPGGAGVREWVTLIVLGTVTDPTHALLCVITARILFIVVESAMALVSHFALRAMSPASA
ncbi:flippase-like domain-containing protein [Rhodopirellula sp. JC740]|uniref:Flippase-like domain-containing protein n=2 Tax=Rhodopirellula halodulae TaxID=2894198 RepID=A0ABS8ND37_9BACT|nr:lysylphosphatidylglycerol synthase domain-containing protein [Rhodopirellula sp. JC740]MCC9641459.1 flippase-like domain-containing protein [Rhodopirellula sp. JC740]